MQSYLLQRDATNSLCNATWLGLISYTAFRRIEWIIHLFIQKEAKVTFLLPSIIILGEDGEVYMPGPRIPMHRTSCMLLCYTKDMKVATTFWDKKEKSTYQAP